MAEIIVALIIGGIIGVIVWRWTRKAEYLEALLATEDGCPDEIEPALLYPLMRFASFDHALSPHVIITTGKLIDDLYAENASIGERIRIMGEALKKERRRCADLAVKWISNETGYSPVTWEMLHAAIMADPHHVTDPSNMVSEE